MTKKRLTEKRPQTGRFVIGESSQKISLVEGIRMTGDTKKAGGGRAQQRDVARRISPSHPA